MLVENTTKMINAKPIWIFIFFPRSHIEYRERKKKKNEQTKATEDMRPNEILNMVRKC